MATDSGLDWLPLPAALVDDAGVVLECNVAFSCLLRAADRPSIAVIGSPLERFMPDEPSWGVVLVGGREGCAVRVHLRRADDVPVSADVLRADGPVPGTHRLVFTEVADRRLLAETQRVLDVAFDIAEIGMALFSTDGCYIRVNDALCRILVRDRADLIGRRDQEFTHPDDREADVAAAWLVLNGQTDTHQAEKRFITPDGEVIWTIANLTFLRDEAGRPLCWLGQFTDITTRRMVEDSLRHLADHDDLTGLASRRRLIDSLREAIDLASRERRHGCLLLMDLDGFKQVNDRCGHERGDAVLREVAEALQALIPATSTVGRLGGDEFAVVLPLHDLQASTLIARQVEQTVRDLGVPGLGVSCGVARFGGDRPQTPEAVLATADHEMYRRKQALTGQDGAIILR